VPANFPEPPAIPEEERIMTTLLHRLAAGAVFLLLGASAAWAQTTAPATGSGATGSTAATAPAPKPDTVVAIVNGKKLTRADVIDSAASLPAEYRSQVDAYFPQLIDRLVDITVMVDEGRKQNLQDDPQVKKMIADAEDQAIRVVLVQKFLADKLSDEQLKKHYDDMVKAMPPSVEIRASHILLANQADAAAVIKQLDAGGDFAKLAKEKSKDTQSAANGGDLDYFTQGDMVPEFWAAAAKLQKGQYTEQPVQTQFGWHVILVTDKRTKPVPSFDQMKDQVKQDLQQELISAWLKDLRKSAQIQKFNPDGTPTTAQ
jgi:peptidyl-prolyl cis-trans isomerase C